MYFDRSLCKVSIPVIILSVIIGGYDYTLVCMYYNVPAAVNSESPCAFI